LLRPNFRHENSNGARRRGQNTLQRAPDGLPRVSTYTIWAVLHDAGITWQRDRWCQTGVAIAAQVQEGLETAPWHTRRTIIRTLVSRVEIGDAQVNVVSRVPPDPFLASPDSLDRGVLQHRRRRADRALGRAFRRAEELFVLKIARPATMPGSADEPGSSRVAGRCRHD
jgi:hypothetical protein